MSKSGTIDIDTQRISQTQSDAHPKTIPIEAPVSVEFNGIGYAVMMATPEHLEDFATGFSLSERVIKSPDEIQDITITETDLGWILRIYVDQERTKPLMERLRTRVAESSCGLCGLENLEQVARPLAAIETTLEISPAAIFRALDKFPATQTLNAATGGVHGAAFCSPGGNILCTREDVGRHNALDKLIGSLARANQQTDQGFFLLSSRCSYELVEKTVLARCPALVTVSNATSMAVERAKAANLTLYVLARADAILKVT